MARHYYHQALPQPYEHLHQVRELSRLSADVSYVDIGLIKSICPKKGIINQLTQIFISTLANKLREENITCYTPKNESRLIELITSVSDFGRCPVVEPIGQTSPRDDGSGTPDTCSNSSGSLVEQFGTEETADGQTRKGKGTKIRKGTKSN